MDIFRLTALLVVCGCAPSDEGSELSEAEERHVVGPGVAEPLCPEELADGDTVFPWAGLSRDYDGEGAAQAWGQCRRPLTAALDADLHLTLDDVLVTQMHPRGFRFDGKVCLGRDSVAVMYCSAVAEAGEWSVEHKVEYPANSRTLRD